MTAPSYIIVGISGGVDSAVAAYLLKQAGHKVRGVFMKNWEGDDTDTFCPATQDFIDAEKVCGEIGIDLDFVNFASEYWQHVFAYFLAEYAKGRTPNPDILCNKEIKFKAFLNYAQNLGADYIATGHYARIHDATLLKALDESKDQSYFLHLLNQEQLSKTIFPIGHLNKTEVRAIARKLGFNNHAKKDSTGICFIGERKFQTFLNEFLPAKPGKIITLEGETIGTHEGVMFYTIGQRQGLKIGGKAGKQEKAWYVAAKNIEQNTLIVVQGDHPSLYQSSLIAHSLHWISGKAPAHTNLTAKIRYRQSEQACLIESLSEKTAKIVFSKPQRAVTPGQAIVFYQDDICLGGGIIES